MYLLDTQMCICHQMTLNTCHHNFLPTKNNPMDCVKSIFLSIFPPPCSACFRPNLSWRQNNHKTPQTPNWALYHMK